jgi:hypothetical protein
MVKEVYLYCTSDSMNKDCKFKKALMGITIKKLNFYFKPDDLDENLTINIPFLEGSTSIYNLPPGKKIIFFFKRKKEN